jgi:hypothetical protein
LVIANAPKEETNIVAATVALVTNKLLNAYLENGTTELLRAVTRTVKFSTVGLLTRNCGGNFNNSSNGLKAVEITYINGSEVKATNIIINKYNGDLTRLIENFCFKSGILNLIIILITL